MWLGAQPRPPTLGLTRRSGALGAGQLQGADLLGTHIEIASCVRFTGVSLSVVGEHVRRHFGIIGRFGP